MTFTKKYDNTGTLTVKIEGRLDTNTAPELEKELKQEYDHIECLVIDFKDLDYISSAGLRVLLAAHKTMQKKNGMVVRNVNEIVSEVLDVTGFNDILTIQ